jgi:hypothetical protein
MQRDYTIDAPAVAMTAGTAYYILGVATSSTIVCDIIDITVGCDATAAGVLKIELISWTVDGTGTAYTPKPINGDAQLMSALITAKIAYTVAPSGTITVFKTWGYPLPLAGPEIMLPLGREITIPKSSYYGMRLTPTTVSPNGYCNWTVEE